MRRAAWILAVAVAVAGPALGQESGRGLRPPPVPWLTVQGDARVQAAPDEATVRLGVVAQAPTAGAAQAEVNRVANAVLAAVGRLGVPRERIQTSELQLFPVYSQEPQPVPERAGEPRITGYRATNAVSVRLDQLDKVGPVVDAGLGAGANQVEGVSFGLRSDLAARQQALREAAAEARQKAQALAAALGVELVELLEAAEGGTQVVTPRFAMARMAADTLEMQATPVAPGQIAVDASVTLTFRIAPAAAPRP
jgi:hypothetical protein